MENFDPRREITAALCHLMNAEHAIKQTGTPSVQRLAKELTDRGFELLNILRGVAMPHFDRERFDAQR
jgi:hypothetical protein